MRKRAGLARAMAKDPDYLFLDEPSAGLDPITAAEMDELITTIRDRFGTTIVVITHELASLYLIADRLVMLAQKKVLAEGTFDELSRNKNPLIQDFFNRKAPPPAVDLGSFGGRLVGNQPPS
jgi:phospholipid/cholesterol/gamma-HCH transport system ATP-binding protein